MDIDQEILRKATETPAFVPWVEKYRPSTVGEVSH